MRERTSEHYIEIPLSEYRTLVEENFENRFHMRNALEDACRFKIDLEEMKNAHAKLSEAYEQALEELERYKKMYAKPISNCKEDI